MRAPKRLLVNRSIIVTVKPLLSEFSYGYALTEELATGAFGPLTGAPIFPSLIAEGSLGYDVQLPYFGAPLFIQFKLSDKLVRRNAAEAAEFGLPYFRFHLRSRKYSVQHDLLQHLQASGEEVFYAAPLFFSQDELNERYTTRTVFSSSALFEPLDIDLPDDEDHYVAFSAGSSFFTRCSESKKRIEKKVSASVVGESAALRLHNKSQRIDRQFFMRLSRRMLELSRANPDSLAIFENREFLLRKRNLDAAEAGYAAFLARSLFGAELFIISRPPE
jgi:hypothetical protein